MLPTGERLAVGALILLGSAALAVGAGKLGCREAEESGLDADKRDGFADGSGRGNGTTGVVRPGV